MLAVAVERFPPPQFTETGHQLPVLTGPAARAPAWEYIDVGVLFLALALAAWLALRRRSRGGLVALGIFALLYFGFWRRGCVCAIGSIQNIVQAVCDPAYAAPWSVVAFGLLPLAFALLFGRVFCSAVCPHGALQDLLLLKPVRVPPWLEHGLRLVAHVYLGVALIFAATGGGYPICQYDPFVPIFRLGGGTVMVVAGAGLLLLGVFVGRPYCRFFCPYGVLLGLAARVSRWRVRITPATCTRCRLCEQSCPFNAIDKSTLDEPPLPAKADKRRLAVLLLLLPFLLAAGWWLGGGAGAYLARGHRVVSLAERVSLEDRGLAAGTTDASAAFRALGTPAGELFRAAHAVRDRFALAGRLCGLWIGLVFGLKLIALAVRRRRDDYEADQARCLACARCYEYCPEKLNATEQAAQRNE